MYVPTPKLGEDFGLNFLFSMLKKWKVIGRLLRSPTGVVNLLDDVDDGPTPLIVDTDVQRKIFSLELVKIWPSSSLSPSTSLSSSINITKMKLSMTKQQEKKKKGTVHV